LVFYFLSFSFPHVAFFVKEGKEVEEGRVSCVEVDIVYWLPNMDSTISPPRMARTERRESLNCKE